MGCGVPATDYSNNGAAAARRHDGRMSLYIDSASRLHHDQDQNLVVTCPHCQTVAHITP